MFEERGNKEANDSGNFTVVNKLQENDYRRIITQLHNEILAKNERLKGVKALTVMLHESEEKRKRMEAMANNYEMTLKRAEARIAQLNKTLGVGPQAAFNRGVVMPGVSRKDFELVTQENVRLRKALDHIVPTNLGGHDVILKNQELYDLVSTLQEDLSQSDNHVKELELALRDRENGGSSVVPELTRKVMKLERSLNAKQVFCETLIKENDKLKKLTEEVSNSDKQEKRDYIDGRYHGLEEGCSTEKADELKEENKKIKEENNILQKRIAEMESIVSDLEPKIQALEEEKKKLKKQASEFASAQREKEQENQRKAAAEKEKQAKDINELKKKCDGFFQQVVSLNSKQKESEEELERIKRAFELQGAELEEKKSMIHLMTESLKSYEDDFRRENEEKAKFQKMADKSQQETERTKRENQSHMATIRHLEDEFERMNRMLNEERKRNNDVRSKPGYYPSPIVAAAGTRSLFPEHRPMQVVADGGGGGVDESDANRRQDPYSLPTTKSESSNAPSLIECPYCSRSYPYHLIEGHVQDCMEDSLYMDEKD